MSDIIIDALAVQKAFLSAAVALDAKKEWINELNVFPVPDGDTGTNMTLTIMSAAYDVDKLVNPDMETVCKVISSGTLRGARGNSGVITSQLIRGLSKSFASEEDINAKELANAFAKAVDTAYKAVMKPKEGTILTVARAMSERALKLSKESDDIEFILRETIKAGDYALSKTPEMLPVLKQAGVVDAGGQGLMVLTTAAFESILGNSLEFKGLTDSDKATIKVNKSDIDTSDIKFGYCTEFIIKSGIDSNKERELKSFLESMGDSIVCVADDDFVKIHVHTNDPGKVISRALTYGELSRLKIDNMREEHNELVVKSQERKPYAIISVSSGEGLTAIFKGLGVDFVIEGGQTMNPSTDDIANAIERANADVVYVLPNNKNIILAAKQAADIVDDVNVVVIPSKSIPLGISALMCFNPEASVDDNQISMIGALDDVKYCEVTNAVRDTNIDGFEIKNGDFMTIGDKGMLSVAQTPKEAAVEGIKKLIDEDTEIVTIYYGDNTTEDEANEISDTLEAEFPSVEFDVENGGQPVYNYFISVE